MRFRSDRPGRRPKLLVLNQYYQPRLEATAQLLAELCTALADDFDITVITGSVGDPSVPLEEVRDGVRIIRVRSTSYERSRLSRRATNYVTYMSWSLLAAMRERPDVVFAMTDPPMIGAVALVVARRFRVPLVVTSQDIFPEVAVELGRLRNPILVELLRATVELYVRRADRIVAIGETMQKRLEGKGASPERIRVIPNWVQAGQLTPQPRDNRWAREHGLTGKFVLMHSGNVGHAQNLETVIRAASFLRDLDDLVVAIIGSGARWDEIVALADRLEVDAVRFFPYQPRAELALSLSSADLHVVGLAKGLSGYVVPSRLYGIMAVGQPVIVVADPESETAQLVQEVGCGVVVPAGSTDALAAVVRRARSGEFDLEEMGRRGREYVIAEADLPIAVGRYRELLRGVVA
jgi:colanic acid biosynthesis glycosyl transferase WcaI